MAHMRRLEVPLNIPIPLDLVEVIRIVSYVTVGGHDGHSCRVANSRIVDFPCDLCPCIRVVGDIHSTHFGFCSLTCPECPAEGT